MRKTSQAPVVIVAILLLVTSMTISALPNLSSTAIPVVGLKNRLEKTRDNLPLVMQDQQIDVVESSTTARGIYYIPNIISENDFLPFIQNVVGPNAVLPYIPNMIPGAVMSEGVAPPVDIANYDYLLKYLTESTVTSRWDEASIQFERVRLMQAERQLDALMSKLTDTGPQSLSEQEQKLLRFCNELVRAKNKISN